MMKAILSATLLFCSMSLAAAQEGSLKFETDIHDFGDIDQGEKVTTVFKFENTSSSPVEILNVSTSCGCTSAKPEKDVYQPGEKGEIPVTFNSTRFSGKITKRVTISTNDESNPKQVVTIKGNVVVDIIVKPSTLFFAKAELGKKSEQKIQISTDKLDKLVLSNLKTEPEYVSASLTMEGDKNASITVTVDGAKFPSGKRRLNGVLTFDTNSESMGNVKTNISINVERPIRTSPNAVYFFASKPGQERTMNVRLMSTKGQSFKLGDITTDADYLKVSVTKNEDGTKELTVVLNGDAPKGKFMSQIKVKTDMEGQKEVVIPVRGSVL